MLSAAAASSGVAVLPVLDVVLHVEVVDEQRVPQFGVADSLIQREAWWVHAKTTNYTEASGIRLERKNRN